MLILYIANMRVCVCVQKKKKKEGMKGSYQMAFY